MILTEFINSSIEYVIAVAIGSLLVFSTLCIQALAFLGWWVVSEGSSVRARRMVDITMVWAIRAGSVAGTAALVCIAWDAFYS